MRKLETKNNGRIDDLGLVVDFNYLNLAGRYLRNVITTKLRDPLYRQS